MRLSTRGLGTRRLSTRGLGIAGGNGHTTTCVTAIALKSVGTVYCVSVTVPTIYSTTGKVISSSAPVAVETIQSIPACGPVTVRSVCQ